MGVHHGLAQLVGGRTGIPHGLSNAIILPAAMAYNAVAVPDAMALLARALGVDDATAAVEALVERLGLPSRLSDVGVDDEDIDAVARLSQASGPVRANPRPVSEDDARAILESVY
jgi:maleylacetate reductase